MKFIEKILIIIYVICAILLNINKKFELINDFSLIFILLLLSIAGLCASFINYKNFSFFDSIFILTIILWTSTLFKVLHWAGANELMLIGYTSYILIVIALLKSAIENRKNRKVSWVYFVIVVILIIQSIAPIYGQHSKIFIIGGFLNYILLMMIVTLLFDKQYFKKIDSKIFVVIGLPTFLLILRDTLNLIG